MKQALRFTNRRQAIAVFFAFTVFAGLSSIASGVRAQNVVIADETDYSVRVADAAIQGSDSLARHALKVFADEKSAGITRVAVAADFDADGVADLLVAQNDRIVLHRGNIDAFAPQTEAAFEAIRDGRFVSPFEQKIRTTQIPVAADFIFSGDFNRDGKLDAAFAARNDNFLYVLEGDGAGNFPNLRRIETAGAITTVAAGDVNRADGLTDLIVGTNNADGFGLQIFSGLGDIFAHEPLFYNLPAQAEAIAVGQLNENDFNDIAVGTDSEVLILSGADSLETANESKPEMLRLPLSGGVKSIVAGDLMPDRDNRTELAVLSPDGTIRILARGTLDTRPVTATEHLAEQVRDYQAKGYPIPQKILKKLSKADLRETAARLQGDVTTWTEAETVTTSAPDLRLSPQTILTTARLSNSAAEDLIVLDQSGNRVTVMPFQSDGSRIDGQNIRRSFDGKRRTQEFETDGAPVAALALKLNYDNETDLLVLKDGGESIGFVSAPQATFTVNSAADAIDNNLNDNVCNTAGGVCTLRAAIMQANRTPGNDTIMINAGINPTISLGQPDNDAGTPNDQATGDLDITCVITDPNSGGCDTPLSTNLNNLSIVGAAGGNVVSAGTFSPYPVNGGGTINTDRVFDVGEDGIFGGGFGGGTGLSATFTNLTIQNGNVRQAENTQLGGGNYANGGGVRYDGFGNGFGTLTLNNTTVTNNQADNAGGGVYQVYGTFSAGTTTFSSNIAKAGEGGGVFFGAATSNSNVSISNSTFNANQAQQGTVFGTFTANADGGGVRLNTDLNTFTVTNTNFTNNIAQQDGGAIKTLNGAATVTGGTMTGNTARRHGGVSFGDQDTAGGTRFLTFSGSTMRNNTANSDNAIAAGDGAAGDGGAIFRDRGTSNITNCIIGGTNAGEPNRANNGGGVAHAFTVDSAAGNTSNQTIVNINGGSINGNVANTDGGGVYFNAATFDVTASALNIGATTAAAMDGNKATGNGGAISVSGGATANLNNMTVRSNQANSNGGAFYQNNGTTTFTGTLTIGGSGFANSAFNGGGIFNNAGTITLPNAANISFNAAGANGGGINNAGTINSFTGATINSNSAGTSGGGIYNTGTIAVSGATMSGNTAPAGSSVTQAGGVFNMSGTNALGGDLAITGGTFNANASIVNLTGNFAQTGGTFNGSTSVFNVGGNFGYTAGTFTANTNTFNFNGAAAQTVSGAVTFNNFTVNNSLGVTLNSNETVNGILTLASGALNVSSPNTLTLNSTVTLNGGTINGAAGSTVNYAQTSAGQNVAPGSYGNLTFSNFSKILPPSNVNIAGTFTPGTAASHTVTNNTITFNGTAAQTIPAFTFNNLTLSNSAGATLTGNATVGGALALTSGTLNVSTFVLTLNGAASQTGGAFASAATGTVNYNQSSAGQNVLTGNYGNLTFSNFSKNLPSAGTVGVAGTFTPNSAANVITGSTFNFNGAGSQTIPVFNYNNLTISGARGNASITLASGTIGVAAIFNPSATNVNYITTGNTIDFNGAAAQTVPAFNYNNLTISGARGGAAITLANGGSISVGGAFNPNATGTSYTTTGNTFVFNGAGAQTIPQFAYNNLSTAGSGTKTLGGTVDVLANLVIGAGTTLDVSASNFPLNVARDFTNNGTFAARAGTVALNGAAAQSVSGMTFNNLTANNAAGITFTGAATVNGALSLQTGFVNMGAFVMTLPVGATATRDAGCSLTNCFVASSSAGGVLKQFSTTANQNFTFPVGTTGGADNGYSPVALTGASSLAGTSGLTVSAIDQAPAGVGSQAITRYWQLTESGSLQTNLAFTYLDADDNGITYPSQLRVFRGTTNMCATDCVDENTFTGSVSNITDFSPWTIAAPLAPTAASVTVSGRAATATGRGIGNAQIRMTDASGKVRTAITSKSGYYRFADVEAGETYILTVKGKGFVFSQPSQALNINEDTSGVDFIGTPLEAGR